MEFGGEGLIVVLGGERVVIGELALLLILLGLTLVLCALAGRELARPRRTGRSGRCRWKRDAAGRRPPFERWWCAACRVEAYSTDVRPPKECKRALKAGEVGL